MHLELKQLQETLGLYFENETVLQQAFTHASYVNEHRGKSYKDNERLEFLGDAVLELTVSEYLYEKYPDRPEGELTKLRASIVCEPSLVGFAELLNFGDYVLLGKGEELTGGRTRPALLADVFEAFIGALYLDGGLAKVQQFLGRHLFPRLPEQKKLMTVDYKTLLQEYAQQRNMGTPQYRIVSETGPAHDREFASVVSIHEQEYGQGKGRSKKEAEQQAAAYALQVLEQQGV